MQLKHPGQPSATEQNLRPSCEQDKYTARGSHFERDPSTPKPQQKKAKEFWNSKGVSTREVDEFDNETDEASTQFSFSSNFPNHTRLLLRSHGQLTNDCINTFFHGFACSWTFHSSNTGIAYVDMENATDAQRAFEELDGRCLLGSPVVLELLEANEIPVLEFGFDSSPQHFPLHEPWPTPPNRNQSRSPPNRCGSLNTSSHSSGTSQRRFLNGQNLVSEDESDYDVSNNTTTQKRESTTWLSTRNQQAYIVHPKKSLRGPQNAVAISAAYPKRREQPEDFRFPDTPDSDATFESLSSVYLDNHSASGNRFVYTREHGQDRGEKSTSSVHIYSHSRSPSAEQENQISTLISQKHYSIHDDVCPSEGLSAGRDVHKARKSSKTKLKNKNNSGRNTQRLGRKIDSTAWRQRTISTKGNPSSETRKRKGYVQQQDVRSTTKLKQLKDCNVVEEIVPQIQETGSTYLGPSKATVPLSDPCECIMERTFRGAQARARSMPPKLHYTARGSARDFYSDF
jgi:hypothetical protein